MNKTVVITGGAQGQGKAHCLAFARLGYDVVVADLFDPQDRAKPTAQVVDEIGRMGARALGVRCDVTSPEQVEALFREAADAFGTIDVVVANAGIMLFGRTWELREEDVWRTLDINLMGVWRTDKEAVKYMLRQGRGRIINISSTAGLKPPSSGSHYAMSKYGVIGLTKTLAREVVRERITVNAVCPTMVHTPMTERKAFVEDMARDLGTPFDSFEDMDRKLSERRPMGIAFLEPEDVSGVCLWLGTSREARLITGAAIAVDAGSML